MDRIPPDRFLDVLRIIFGTECLGRSYGLCSLESLRG